jgi:hypothetical protein
MTTNLNDRKLGVETVVAPFTDHMAVVLRLRMDVLPIYRGRGYLRMNTRILKETPFKETVTHKWQTWESLKGKYRDLTMWWEKYVKKELRYLFIVEGTTRRREDAATENFYNACIYDVLKEPDQHNSKLRALQHLKAKIIRLYNRRMCSLAVGCNPQTLYPDEHISLYHLIKPWK